MDKGGLKSGHEQCLAQNHTAEVIRGSVLRTDRFRGPSLFTAQVKHWGESVP